MTTVLILIKIYNYISQLIIKTIQPTISIKIRRIKTKLKLKCKFSAVTNYNFGVELNFMLKKSLLSEPPLIYLQFHFKLNFYEMTKILLKQHIEKLLENAGTCEAVRQVQTL